ncbi:MAG: hypothetical protein K9I82_01655 [Chitinophagaceae bacterium]|nr:hypothetical protein [Chitinophagaceae bacterium]
MKNINYTIGAKFSNTLDEISNKIFDSVSTSIADKSFNIKEDVMNQVLEILKKQIYEKH